MKRCVDPASAVPHCESVRFLSHPDGAERDGDRCQRACRCQRWRSRKGSRPRGSPRVGGGWRACEHHRRRGCPGRRQGRGRAGRFRSRWQAESMWTSVWRSLPASPRAFRSVRTFRLLRGWGMRTRSWRSRPASPWAFRSVRTFRLLRGWGMRTRSWRSRPASPRAFRSVRNVSVAVGVGDGFSRVSVAVGVCDSVIVAVGVGETVSVAVLVTVDDGVGVGVTVAVGVLTTTGATPVCGAMPKLSALISTALA